MTRPTGAINIVKNHNVGFSRDESVVIIEYIEGIEAELAKQEWVIGKFSDWYYNEGSDCPYTEYRFCPNLAEREKDYNEENKDEVSPFPFEPTDDGNCDYMMSSGGCFAKYYEHLYDELPKKGSK